MIVAAPADTPVTRPDAELTKATPVLLLLHTPPLTELVSVVELPAQTVVVPPIDPGAVFTVNAVFVIQPNVGVVYVSKEVPAETPVTTPEVEPTVATPVLPLTHVPPVTEGVSVDVWPEQMLVEPDIAAEGLTVKVVCA